MIYKMLQLIYTWEGEVKSVLFPNWKKLHMFLFEHSNIIDIDPDLGVYEVAQDDYKKMELLRLRIDERGRRQLNFAPDVPASVLFEIVTLRASAQL